MSPLDPVASVFGWLFYDWIDDVPVHGIANGQSNPQWNYPIQVIPNCFLFDFVAHGLFF